MRAQLKLQWVAIVVAAALLILAALIFSGQGAKSKGVTPTSATTTQVSSATSMPSTTSAQNVFTSANTTTTTGQITQYYGVVLIEYAMIPNALIANAGEPITINFMNNGNLTHDIEIRPFYLQTGLIPPGSGATMSLSPLPKGNYTLYSNTGADEQKGMVAKLTVR